METQYITKRYFIATYGSARLLGEMGRRKVIEAAEIEDAKVQFLTWYMNQPELMTHESMLVEWREEEGLNTARSNIEGKT